MREDIKYIIFDLSEVLLRGLYGTHEIIGKKLNLPADEVSDVLLKAAEDLFLGRVSEDDYCDNIIKDNEWPVSAEELKVIIRSNFAEIPGTCQIAEDLKKAGYGLVLLSVHAREWIEYCRDNFSFEDLFEEKAFYSFDRGCQKPDPQAFKDVLEEIKAHPEECLFIDDSEANIKSAENLGIKAILFKGADDLREELKNQSFL